MQFRKNQSLDKVEAKLHRELEDSVVVGELNLSEGDLNKLIDLVKKEIKLDDQIEVIKYLWTVYPNTSLVITVFIAVYNYDGSLWNHFTEKTGIEDTAFWKKNLMAYLKSSKIRVFHEKEHQKYFNTILGHAGVPYYSVEKLLENIIIPANNRGWNEIDIYENVKRLDYNSLLHKGVRTFIELGDRVSFSLIHRMQSVWRNRNKPFVTNYPEYLPNHILQAMDEYELQEEDNSIDYKRPYLQYMVKEATVNLHIPAIRVKDRYIDDLYWIVRELNGREIVKVELECLYYENGAIKEYIPKDDRMINLKPNHTYFIELFFEDEYLERELIYKDQLFVEPSFIQFNNDKKLVGLKEAYLGREYYSVALVVENKQVPEIKDKIKSAIVEEEELMGAWSKYSAVTVSAVEKEVFSVEGSEIKLNNMLMNPYLDGDKQDHLAHVEYPVFKDKPYLVLTEKVIQEIKQERITHIRISNLHDHVTKHKDISVSSIEYQDNEARLYMDEIFPEVNEKMGSYSVSIYGKLGYDYHFTFILMTDIGFQLDRHSRKLNLSIPHDYSFIIQWPMNVETWRRKGKYYIVPPDNQYKMKAVLYNRTSHISYDFILYTSLYQIQFVGKDQQVYQLEAEISREEWGNNQFIEVDTTNPTFEKEYGKSCEMKVLGGPKPIVYALSSNATHYFPTGETFEKTLDRDILYQYQFSTEERKQPFLAIRNKWNFSKFEKHVEGMELALKWEQSNYLNEKFIRIWKLHQPYEDCIDIPLNKRSRTFRYSFHEPGIYMVEWKDSHILDEDKPVFENCKFDIMQIGTEKSLAYFLLLKEDDEKNFGNEVDLNYQGYELSAILGLLNRINHFGSEYLSLIVEDYDTCCQFAIRAGDVLSDIQGRNKIGKHLSDILGEISGVQELDNTVLFTIHDKIIHNKFRENFEEKISNSIYFSQKRLLSDSNVASSKQLNIDMQELKPFNPVIYDFDLRMTIVKYFYKVKNDQAYKEYVLDLLETYSTKLGDIYNKYKGASERDVRFYVFREIDNRNLIQNVHANGPGYEHYPYFIAQLALVNRAFLRFSDKYLTNEEIKHIRESTQQLLRLDKYWFLHDLFYLDLLIDKHSKSNKSPQYVR